MKNAIIVLCIGLLAIQATLVDAGHRKNRNRQRGTMPSPEKMAEIKGVVETLNPDCRKAIEKYGKGKATLEKNCAKLERYSGFLSKKGCTQEDHDKLYNVLMCGGGSSDVEYQAQKEATNVTQKTTSMPQRTSNVTQGINNVPQQATSGPQQATSGPQRATNVTQGPTNATEETS